MGLWVMTWVSPAATVWVQYYQSLPELINIKQIKCRSVLGCTDVTTATALLHTWHLAIFFPLKFIYLDLKQEIL